MVVVRLACPECQKAGRRLANGSTPILRNGTHCRTCGFVFKQPVMINTRNYHDMARRAWVTRKGRYGPSGVRPQVRYPGIEMFA